MLLTSPAFDPGAPIPDAYTCDGSNISPELRIQDVPAGTKSLALIVDDPDAPKVWVHWVLYDLPPNTTRVPEHVRPSRAVPGGGIQGTNDFPAVGYGGPCPPRGTHRYFFKLYALDRKLGLAPGATKEQVLKAMQGHVLGSAELMGTYQHR